MKIALVSPYDFPYPGGVTEHIVALAAGIRQRGHEVQVLAACSGYQNYCYPDTHSITQRITSVSIAGTVARVGLSPLSYGRIKKILQRELFDVIHLQEPLTPSITWGFLMYVHNLPETVTVGTFHAYHERPSWLYRYGRPVFEKLFTKLDSLIAVSKAAYRFAYQMFPGDYRIIPNGIDLDRFGSSICPNNQTERCDPQTKKTVLFVGRLDKRKGFATLLMAFLKLKANFPQLRLQVIGPFEARDCRLYKKIAQEHQAGDIEFIGYISPEKLPHYYHNADIFCAPSIGFESFGIVLLEAMAAGIPIVASNIAGYRSVITDGQEGVLVPPDRPDDLASALAQLLNNPRQRMEMGARGRRTAGHFSWDHVVDQTLAVYVDTIQNKASLKSKLNSSTNKLPNHAVGYRQRR